VISLDAPLLFGRAFLFEPFKSDAVHDPPAAFQLVGEPLVIAGPDAVSPPLIDGAL